MALKIKSKVAEPKKVTKTLKTIKPIKKSAKAVMTEMKIVPITSIKTYDRNPRIGDVDEIAKSLDENAQYRPLVVQKSTKKILAGNHTYLAARRLGWSQVAIVEVDVDDERARKIVLADNKTADLGSYDNQILAELLGQVSDISGTGFSDDEASDLLQLLDSGGASASDLDGGRPDFGITKGDGAFGDDDDDDDDSDDDDLDPGSAEWEKRKAKEDDDGFVGASDKLAGALKLADPDDLDFESVGRWGIPKLRTDMLMQTDEIPDNLLSWAGSATKDWPDEDQWWLYNYGIDSTSGMKDPSKMILCFYAFDDYFERWFDDPSKYTTKAVNSGVKYAVSPNYSTYADVPMCVNLLSIFKSRYVGRYFQECGIKVIPNIEWCMDKAGSEWFLDDIVLKTLPKNTPVISVQGQTDRLKEMSEAQRKSTAKQYRHVTQTVNCETLVYYSTKANYDWLMNEGKFSCDVLFIENRMAALSAQAAKREKKTGL